MARPIPLDLPPRNPWLELQSRLEAAPAEHAEALLAAYEVLQALHDRGVLNLLRGGLGSGDKVLEIATDAANSPDSIRAIRNLVLLLNLLSSIEPEVLGRFTRAVPEAMHQIVRDRKQAGLWTLLKDFLWNRDFRSGMAALNTLLATLGRSIVGPRE